MARGYGPCFMRIWRDLLEFSDASLGHTLKINRHKACRGLLNVTSLSSRQYSTYSMPPISLTTPNTYLKRSSNKDYPYEVSAEVENMITKGDPTAKRKLQELLVLLYLMKERGDLLPELITVNELTELITLNEEDQIYLVNLIHFRRRRTGETKSAKKISQKQVRPEQGPDTFLNYDDANNTMFSSETLIKSDMSRYYNTNLAKGLLFGQKIVFDCSFDDYMSYPELRATASELNKCIRINRRNRRPFAFYFCNLAQDSKLVQHLRRINPSLADDLPVIVNSSSYLDLFYREDIVYLSPYVKRELIYHPDDIYVIGALTGNQGKLSVKKAQSERVRCFRLPLGFSQLIQQSPVLSIIDTYNALLSKKNSGLWSHAPEIRKNLAFR